MRIPAALSHLKVPVKRLLNVFSKSVRAKRAMKLQTERRVVRLAGTLRTQSLWARDITNTINSVCSCGLSADPDCVGRSQTGTAN